MRTSKVADPELRLCVCVVARPAVIMRVVLEPRAPFRKQTIIIQPSEPQKRTLTERFSRRVSFNPPIDPKKKKKGRRGQSGKVSVATATAASSA